VQVSKTRYLSFALSTWGTCSNKFIVLCESTFIASTFELEVSGLLKKSSVLGWVGFENFHIVQPEENNSQVGNNSLSCCSSFQCGGMFLGIQQRILLSELDSFDLTWKYFNLI